MRGFGWGSVGTGLCTVMLALSGGQARAKDHGPTDEPLIGSGSLTISWQGDPARGCAAEGLCGVSGAVTLDAEGGADALSFGRGPVDLTMFSSPTVRVRRATGLGAPADCTELLGPGYGDILVARRAGKLTARLTPPLSSGRCAGPIQSDVTKVAIPVRESGHRFPAFDLRTTKTFAAGPFTATIESTLEFRPDRSSGLFVGSSSIGSLGVGGRPHRVLVEQVTARYRLSALPNALTSQFQAASGGLCATLDACGVSGTLALSLSTSSRTFVVTASKVVHRRVSARRILADFRRGLIPLDWGQPSGSQMLSTTTAETLDRGGTPSCSDTAAGDAELLGPPLGRSQLGLVLIKQDQESGLLRTHCPGPLDEDVMPGLAHGGYVARGRVTLSQLLSPASSVSLTWPGQFDGSAYAGARAGSLELSLTPIGITAGMARELR